MSRTITYTCDRCKRSSVGDPTVLKLEEVRVTWGEQRLYSRGIEPWASSAAAKDWCLQCRIEMGIQNPAVAGVTLGAMPTLEDLVRKIAYEEASNVCCKEET